MNAFLVVALTLMIIALAVVIEERAGLLSVGDPAPDFRAILSTGEEVSLASFRGRSSIVLYFYPRDFTSGCTAQACSFRDHYDEIRTRGATLFGVSADGGASHRTFADRYSLPFPLISDTDGTIAAHFGVRRLWGLIPLNKRVTYVIDREGIIRAVSHHEIQMDRHQTDVISALSALR